MGRIAEVNCFSESLTQYRDGYAIVVVDVILATTTAVTGVALTRKCCPTPSLEAATSLVEGLENPPLLVGELGGHKPCGFDLTNSLAAVALRSDTSRPMILLSTSGTKVLCEAAKECDAVYAACLRNYSAQVRFFAARHRKVAVIGAGTRGEFREEDQMYCAWIAEGLMTLGYKPRGEQTVKLVERWSGCPVDALLSSKSVEYLRRTAQLGDLYFILEHIGDVDAVFALKNGEITAVNKDNQSRLEAAS
jgi:2-phosphosulfolactate phosphatase